MPSSSRETVLVQHGEGFAEVTMHRPEKLNALNPQLQVELGQVLHELDADPAVKAIILTGAGRAFTAGIDLKNIGPSLGMEGDQDNALRVFRIIDEIQTPLIGAINGFAVTGGMEIALACDILVASTEARFADTHCLIGVIPGAGLSQKLSRIIGLPRAMYMSLTGAYITAQQAYEWGLVSHVVEPAALMPTARDIATAIAGAHSETVHAVKALIKAGSRETLGDALQRETREHGRWKAENNAAEAGARSARVFTRGREQN